MHLNHTRRSLSHLLTYFLPYTRFTKIIFTSGRLKQHLRRRGVPNRWLPRDWQTHISRDASMHRNWSKYSWTCCLLGLLMHADRVIFMFIVSQTAHRGRIQKFSRGRGSLARRSEVRQSQVGFRGKPPTGCRPHQKLKRMLN